MSLILGAAQQKRRADSAFYSTRKKNPDYEGYCIKVRRSSDNALQDIGFVDDIVDVDSLETFIGANSGYIQIWYDQSGNRIDLEQTNSTLQPYIILSGTLILERGIPAIYWNGGQYMLTISNFHSKGAISIFLLAKLYTLNTNQSRILSVYPDGYFMVATHPASKNIHVIYGSGSDWGSITTEISNKQWLNKFALVTCINTAEEINNSYMYIFGTPSGIVLTDPMDLLNNKIIAGGMYAVTSPPYTPSTSQCWKGTTSEIQIYGKNVSSLRENIESDIMSAFSVKNPNRNTAEEFLDITGITDETISGAINTLVEDLIDAGIWEQMLAVYPFVGGTADTHKYNLKDPVDSDYAFRLSYYGTLTHSNTGMVGDRSTGYADTHFIPSDNLVAASQHICYYSRNDSAAGNVEEIGSFNNTWQLAIAAKYSDNNFYAIIGQYSYTSNTNATGFFIASKSNAGKISGYKNSSVLIDEVSATDGLSTKTVTLMAWNNNGSIQRFCDRECAFASMGYGLTRTKALALNTIVQKFQTTLGRNV